MNIDQLTNDLLEILEIDIKNFNYELAVSLDSLQVLSIIAMLDEKFDKVIDLKDFDHITNNGCTFRDLLNVCGCDISEK
tara:strand:- start:374 stop:610 length:237 start_codon:yes stop_codon:yes gene_type:complete